MEGISSILTWIELAISESVDGRAVLSDLDAVWFDEQVVASKCDEVEMAKWASSTVIDDNVQAPVFSERVFSWLHYGVSGAFNFPIGHAGLMHVYGYLLSSVETPYGLKRQRWLTDDFAKAFGLKPSFFFPTASTVPLMQRVASAVLPLLTDPAADSRTVLAVDEVVDWRRRMRTVYICDRMTDSTALVYGSVSGDDVQIVTAFPIGPMTSQSVQDRLAEPARYRYNYAPPDAEPGSHFDGTVQLVTSAF
ncbi:hypothetical protein [Rhodococcus sp. IEGM 1341]|uniref:hypothetical protein n=1 Tax=Rhodococcus sp. IEGM 1341 TaxID=3047090 RepID=UPI0024B7EE91|nr:hypothetical protein [Rhodococcus sp. IEGM 1341]MDI9927406.1 hypothetical protein [Rhodococcus sp. IEGM 1341]